MMKKMLGLGPLKEEAWTALCIAQELDEAGVDQAIVKRLLYLAVDIDWKARNDSIYSGLMFKKPEEKEEAKLSTRDKLQALIDHPDTPEHERESAIRAVSRLTKTA